MAPDRENQPHPPTDLLVLLHGVRQTPQAWQDQVTRLPANLPAVAPWLTGMKPGDTGGFSLPDAAGAVSSVITEYGAERAYLCGQSIGTAVALRAALDDDRVAGLVLASPVIHPPRWVIQAQRLTFSAVPAQRLAAQGLNKQAVLDALDGFLDSDLSGRLGEINVPTLILAGNRDKTGRKGAKRVAGAVPGSRLETIDGGHDLNEENPDRFNQLLFEFLTEIRQL